MLKSKSALLILFNLSLFLDVLAQCPIANTCSPGSAPASAFPFGMGIYNVSVGSGLGSFTNITTTGAAGGYQDFSCNKQATIQEGVATVITINTNPNSDENIRVWIDLNNNGSFDATSELIFSSNNSRIHSGTFTIPISSLVVKNQILRIRVSSDDIASPIPTPCSTPQFGQVEDYGITILNNTNKPSVDFTVNNPVTCSPTVQFSHLVQNGPTSYFWDFGDNTTSLAANPTHTYTTTGTYNVKLKACNANGCDSLTKFNFINYHSNIPISANCNPTTTNYCCGYGITNFTLHTLNNSSQDGSVGYEDFTCTKSITVQENGTYPIAITSNTSNQQDTWVYIDYNNDGNFSNGELTFSKLATVNPAGNLIIKTGGILNTRLRMRVIADAVGNSGNACANRNSGQVEDYTIIIVPNTSKPVAGFTANNTTSCDTIIQFSDQSQNGSTSWSWEFGDGSPKSNLKNPIHNFTTSGIYTIKLRTCNANGCDSLIKTNYIVITKPCLNYCPPTNNSNPNWITNVSFSNLNNSTGREPYSYGNYSSLFGSVTKGNSYPLNVTLNQYPGYLINAYIDYNQDGDFFDKGELVASGQISGPFSIPISIPTNAKTGLTRLRVMSTYSNNTPCLSNDFETETEDYSLNILPSNTPPVAAFFTNGRNSCSYTVTFNDTSAYTPTGWLWNFGDPASGSANTSTLENPVHIFSGPGTYTISLTVTNNFGSNSITKNGYVTITGNTGPRSARCIQTTKVTGPNYLTGIVRVFLNTINNTTSYFDNYQDYSCTHQTTLQQGTNNPITVETGAGTIENVRVWIDYNDDGWFNPNTELAFSSDKKYVHTGNIIPPANAVTNKMLRMRVADEISSRLAPSPCNPLQNGQAEDYGVIIVQPVGLPEQISSNKIKISPNPSNGKFSINISESKSKPTHLEVQNLLGQIIAKRDLYQNQTIYEIEINNQLKGLYLIKIFGNGLTEVNKIIFK